MVCLQTDLSASLIVGTVFSFPAFRTIAVTQHGVAVAVAGHHPTLISPDVTSWHLFSEKDDFYRHLLVPLNCVSEECPK